MGFSHVRYCNHRAFARDPRRELRGRFRLRDGRKGTCRFRNPGSGRQRRELARQPEIYRPQSPLRNAIHVAVVDAGPVNFQVTVLKILVSYPGGFASMADLKRDMAILATSGRDWAERTKRLPSRVPDLDIFSQGLIERLNGCWRITDKGRDLMEARPGANEPQRSKRFDPRRPNQPCLRSGFRRSRAAARTPAAPPRGSRTIEGERLLRRLCIREQGIRAPLRCFGREPPQGRVLTSGRVYGSHNEDFGIYS